MITAIDYDDRQAGDLIVVEAPRRPIPPGWTDLTSNHATAEKVQAYRRHVDDDPDVRDVWGKNGVIVAVFRGAHPVHAPGTDSTAPAITPTVPRHQPGDWIVIWTAPKKPRRCWRFWDRGRAYFTKADPNGPRTWSRAT